MTPASRGRYRSITRDYLLISSFASNRFAKATKFCFCPSGARHGRIHLLSRVGVVALRRKHPGQADVHNPLVGVFFGIVAENGKGLILLAVDLELARVGGVGRR